MSTPTTGTPISTVQRAVYPSWVDLLFPEARTQQLLVQQNTLLAQLVESQGRVPRTGGLALPPIREAAPKTATGPTSSAATTPLPPMLVQTATPAALVTALLAANASAYVQFVLQASPQRVPPRQTAVFQYKVPDQQILVLLSPLTASTDLHAPAVTASVTIDDVPIVTAWALTQDAGVLLGAEATVRRTVEVTYNNGEWDDVTVTTLLVGVLVDLAQYTAQFLPLVQAVYQGLLNEATTVAGTLPPTGG
jgi:hypothetical protein